MHHVSAVHQLPAADGGMPDFGQMRKADLMKAAKAIGVPTRRQCTRDDGSTYRTWRSTTDVARECQQAWLQAALEDVQISPRLSSKERKRKRKGKGRDRTGAGEERKKDGKTEHKKGQGRNEAEGTGAERKGKGEGKDSNRNRNGSMKGSGKEGKEMKGKKRNED